MINSVFGELTYEYGWNGETTIDWFGKIINVNVVVSGEEVELSRNVQSKKTQNLK